LLPDSRNLHKLLAYATGLTALPPLGLTPAPMITFGHLADLPPNDATAEFPCANTCANQLRLPISANYTSFSANMMAAIELQLFTAE